MQEGKQKCNAYLFPSVLINLTYIGKKTITSRQPVDNPFKHKAVCIRYAEFFKIEWHISTAV